MTDYRTELTYSVYIPHKAPAMRGFIDVLFVVRLNESFNNQSNCR